MSRAAASLATQTAVPSISAVPAPLLQRACACGGSAGASEVCAECAEEDLLGREGVQAKLSISAPGDPFEREADTVADRIMSSGSADVSRSGADLPIQRSPAPDASASSRGTVSSLGQTMGIPLPPQALDFFQPRFGRPLDHVRVHDDAASHRLARNIDARAFTHGSDIYFAADEYRPQNSTGRRLLAHELTHVFQQGSGTTLRRQTAEGPVAAPAQQAPPPQPYRRLTMIERLVEWSQAGLLEPPFRPASVDPIPPLPVDPRQAQAASAPAAGAGVAVAGAAPALAPSLPEAPAAPPRWVPRVIPGGGGAPAPGVPPATGAAPLISPLAAGIAAGVIVFLWPRKTAPRWMDEMSPITGDPYSSPEEYDWTGRLKPEQQDFLRRLEKARRAKPQPDLDEDPDPRTQPDPKPAPEEEDNKRGCASSNVPRRGGNKRHDAYADKVTLSTKDYFVSAPPFIGITYDGLTPATRMVWEVKVGHGWLFNPKLKGPADARLALWDAQKNLGMTLAARCGYAHFWSIPDRWIANLLTTRWGGNPPVLAIPE